MVIDTAQPNAYQWMLRALGAYLDEGASCRISLTEVPGGFLVRLLRALHKLDPEVLHFKQETLKAQLEQLTRDRKVVRPSVPPQGIWAHFPNGHQDFLRALGFELDESRARSIFIDELEDGFVVTYMCPAEPDGMTQTKKMVVLGLPEIEAILNAAFDRRSKTQTST